MEGTQVYGPERRLEALLKKNYEKTMEALAQDSARMEQVDPVHLAYMSGRLDGVTDALVLRRVSA